MASSPIFCGNICGHLFSSRRTMRITLLIFTVAILAQADDYQEILDDYAEEVTQDTTTLEPVTQVTTDETTPDPTTTESTTADDPLTTDSPTTESTTSVPTTPTPTPAPDCTEDSDCNRDSEKCEEGVCVCRQGFTKSKSDPGDPKCYETKPYLCEITVSYFGDEEAIWQPELTDKTSELYQEYETMLCDAMIALDFGESADSPYPTCEVIRFSPGSVIADYQIKMPPDTEYTEDEVTNVIQEAMNNGTLEGVTPKNGTLVVTPLNECAEQIDDCHEFADCFDTEQGYRCECKAGFADEYDQQPGYFCALPTQDNSLAIILGAISSALLLALVVLLAVFIYTKQRNRKYISKVPVDGSEYSRRSSSSSQKSSRASADRNIYPSRDRLVLAMDRDDFMGVSNDNLSDTASITDWEQERMEHITKVMTNMPEDIRTRALSSGVDPSQLVYPSDSEASTRAGSANILDVRRRPPSGGNLRLPRPRVYSSGSESSEATLNRGYPVNRKDRITSMPPLREGEPVSSNFSHPFSRMPETNPPPHHVARNQNQRNNENGPSRVTSYPPRVNTANQPRASHTHFAHQYF